MNIKLRFGLHFIIGLCIWLLIMGLIFMLTIDGLFPVIGLYEDMPGYDLLVLVVFALSVALSSIFFSWYFSNPIWYIISWISQLSKGVYGPPEVNRSILTRQGKLKAPYRLYSEVLSNINELSLSLQKAEQEREQLEQLKKDWIAGVSHDLKTPLTYITGYSALLLNKDYTWNEEERHDFLQEILKKGEQMEALIQDFNLSLQINQTKSLIPLKLEEGNIVEFIKGLLADTWNDPNYEQYDLSFHSEETAVLLSFDKRLLYRAMQNLLMNAILHNPEGTQINVSLSNENNQFVKITIQDNGVGMDQQTLENLYKKYYRGMSSIRSEKYGMGLGMAIVKDLIEAHGGYITVDSEQGKGTSFFIILPFVN
ncbi:sensor histidine kinase [Paenibacillus fonticola]|uniref:sensor histidine kinase n=1 Tax=Paenibacillus fonticola TaxID=379896 RepID=UPI00037A661B|nr:HAMP domain-containing sensor histidine kinase [Paenibacillus fonticola]